MTLFECKFYLNKNKLSFSLLLFIFREGRPADGVIIGWISIIEITTNCFYCAQQGPIKLSCKLNLINHLWNIMIGKQKIIELKKTKVYSS